MKIQNPIQRFGFGLAIATLLSLSVEVAAQHVNREVGYSPDKIVFRRNIPDPQAVKRTPLTSDRLSTTSTRLIDARRGFRPYSSVFNDCVPYRRYVGHDDHFGISRPEDRPYSYSQRTPRTYVSQFRNDARPIAPSIRADAPRPAYTLVLRDERDSQESEPDMTIRIHKDRSAIPSTTGAVLITADGTVIQIGD